MVFDRYTIPLVALTFAGLWTMVRKSLSTRGLVIGWSLLSIMASASVLGTADMLQTHNIFWQTVARLQEEGIDVDDLDAGIAYQLTYIYEPALRQRRTAGELFLSGLSPQPFNGLVPPARYLLTFGNRSGWTVRERIPYRTCLRNAELVVLTRQESDMTAP